MYPSIKKVLDGLLKFHLKKIKKASELKNAPPMSKENLDMFSQSINNVFEFFYECLED